VDITRHPATHRAAWAARGAWQDGA